MRSWGWKRWLLIAPIAAVIAGKRRTRTVAFDAASAGRGKFSANGRQ